MIHSVPFIIGGGDFLRRSVFHAVLGDAGILVSQLV